MRPQGIDARDADARQYELLEREILEIADREKERLGRELHDGLCQSLVGVAALSLALSRNLATDGQPGPSAAAAEIVGLLNETIREARDLAHGLGPIALNGVGLAGGLEALARNIRHMHQATCTFAWDGRYPGSCTETETHLVRIAQEAVRNAFAHGRADWIEICLECIDGSGVLSVRDNGVGLADDHRNHGGIGLNTMGYRARAIGGSLAVTRRTEGGTTVACAFPLPQTHDAGQGPADAHAQS